MLKSIVCVVYNAFLVKKNDCVAFKALMLTFNGVVEKEKWVAIFISLFSPENERSIQYKLHITLGDLNFLSFMH